MALISRQTVFNGFLRKSWPLYRGKRAGKLVKLREVTRRHQIRVVQSGEINRMKAFSITQRTHNT